MTVDNRLALMTNCSDNCHLTKSQWEGKVINYWDKSPIPTQSFPTPLYLPATSTHPQPPCASLTSSCTPESYILCIMCQENPCHATHTSLLCPSPPSSSLSSTSLLANQLGLATFCWLLHCLGYEKPAGSCLA